MGNKRIHKLFNELQTELGKAADKGARHTAPYGEVARLIDVARTVDGAHHDYVEAVEGSSSDRDEADRIRPHLETFADAVDAPSVRGADSESPAE